MPDNLSPDDRKRTMRSVLSQKTGPERRLRSILVGMGVKGWVVNPQNITGHPDFAFPDKRIAIFVDGCFWHGCPECHRPLPETNHEYWSQKLQRNVIRDQKNNATLIGDGWQVLRIWEHRLKKKANFAQVVQDIRKLLE